MKIYSCQMHIDQALDELIEKEEVYPVMKAVPESEKLSTKCTYCNESALYVVANK
ncbi:CxxH/CxxC protein [Sporosarcina sp. 6E9]|uniref:CxxH/CxxC protein n=1 Tax=Sporosarcina sp. 6E9 TaxID=2819235 RepID=UPI001AC5097E|nr:CxxH/CxxC protein [Sporosarcina sp. 6E9]MBO1911853.1 CxxH/CxxC protein [Microvirga sp. 3-52]